MITCEKDLLVAQESLQNLEQVLLQALKHHTYEEYRLLSEPILLEIQDRQREILLFLNGEPHTGVVA